MSRSYKRTPITGMTTSDSEKHDKQLANRATRSRNRQRLREGRAPLDRRVISNVATFAKDGRQWCGRLWHSRKDWRK